MNKPRNYMEIKSEQNEIMPCSQRAIVFFNGVCNLPRDFFSKHPVYNEFDVFAADGGADIALKYNLIPQAVLGDMDSISPKAQKKLQGLSTFIRFPAEKNKSDGELLLEKVTADGYRCIHIFAATGGRMDHTLFNLHLLRRFPHATIINNLEEIIYVGRRILIDNREGRRASLIPLGDSVKGVSTEGFKYELEKVDLEFASTLTLSNVIISNTAFIICKKGDLLLVTHSVASPEEQDERRGLKLIKG